MNLRPLIALPLLTLLVSCGNDPASDDAKNGSTPVASAEAERDKWQKPEVVFELMGGVQGKTVADLFASDGYMTSKLIGAGANVIAITNDPAEAKGLEQMKKDKGLGDDRLRIRTVPVGDPGITAEEADMALCMHHYTSIQDRGGFFSKVREGLKAPKAVYIIDFLKTQTPVGPPVEMRIGETQVMDELEPAGFTDVGAYTLKLPYQYVLIAQDFVPGPDEPGGDSVLIQ